MNPLRTPGMDMGRETMETPIIIIGGGGHTRVLIDALLEAGNRPIGYIDPLEPTGLHPDIPWLGDEENILERSPESVLLVNGFGSVHDTEPRNEIFLRFSGLGYRFADVIHPRAILSRQDVSVGEGVQVLAGAVVNTGARLGDNVLIDSGAVVEHDCELESHVHVASGAVLAGSCRVGEASQIGAGATIIKAISIGAGAIIAPGCVVTEDVEALTVVTGVSGRQERQFS